MAKDVILTGIRSNEELTIGNYFGAILPLVDMARNRSSEFQVNIFVPDLHSFTTPVDHSKLFGQTVENLRKFIAAGLPLNIDDVRIYRQSYVPAHSELTIILNNFTGFGEMSRMTQFKDKRLKLVRQMSKESEGRTGVKLKTFQEEVFIKSLLENDPSNSRVTVGLFDYPVLMAADILIYGAKYIPVGDDQTQHLEFTRDIAERMNSQFSSLFVVPEPVPKQHAFFGKDQGLRIMDLVDPTKKMSKSDETGKGVIFLSDDPETAAQKVMSATTDSESTVGNPDSKERPGVANLVQILKLLQPDAPDVSGMGYKEFKETVAKAVKEFLTDFQARLAKVDEQSIEQKLKSDEAKMNEVANATLLKVQQAVGLRPAK